MKAFLKNYRQSPRKVRLVADLIRGMDVVRARFTLKNLNKRSARPIDKLLSSAVANARVNNQKEEETLFVKSITVDEGVTLHRWMPRAFGRATPIRKRSSHITILLEEKK